jgi:hypothetical protein
LRDYAHYAESRRDLFNSTTVYEPDRELEHTETTETIVAQAPKNIRMCQHRNRAVASMALKNGVPGRFLRVELYRR